MPVKYARLPHYLAMIILLGLLALVFINNHYTHLYSDDYLYSFRFNPGFAVQPPATLHYEKIHTPAQFFHSLYDLYNHLTGRIVAHGMLQLALMLPAWLFDLINTLALLTLCYLMVLWITGPDNTRRYEYVLLTFSFFYIGVSNTIPNFYFPAFSCNYIWTQIILLSVLYPWRRYLSGLTTPEGVGFVLLMFVAGLIAGDTNEPVVPGALLFLGITGLYCLKRKQYPPLWFYALSLGLFLGYVFLFFAPGNQQRALYEAGTSHKPTGLAFYPKNLLSMIYSSISTLPAIIIAGISLLRWRKVQTVNHFMPAVSVALMFIGTVFAFLFIPILGARMCILFVSLLIIVCLYPIYNSRLSSSWMLLLYFLVFSPLLGLKILGDNHRLRKGDTEYRQFLREVASSKSDSLLVTPRAYIDPITRSNWAKPIATYHGLQYVWVDDILDRQHLSQVHRTSYQTVQKQNTTSPQLYTIGYLNQNPTSRILYMEFSLPDSMQTKDITMQLFSTRLPTTWLDSLYQHLPRRVRLYSMKEVPRFRDLPYRQYGNRVIYALPIQREAERIDFWRMRMQYHDRKVADIVVKDLDFIAAPTDSTALSLR